MQLKMKGENDCTHFWIIEEPSGPTSKGVCRYCGAVKEFLNTRPMLGKLPIASEEEIFNPRESILGNITHSEDARGMQGLDKLSLLVKFLKSRRQGLSQRTVEFYKYCIRPFLANYSLTTEGINSFLTNLPCKNAKLNYYRGLRTFFNWATEEGYIKDNPIKRVQAPKISKPIRATVRQEQVVQLLSEAKNVRDKAIISLLIDSGLRLNELARIKSQDIDFEKQTIKVWVKGNEQKKAVFRADTGKLLRQVISQNGTGENIWHLKARGIQIMLTRLGDKADTRCNPHAFRRGFAVERALEGMNLRDIMNLGRWKQEAMVLHYIDDINFEDSAERYHQLESRR